MKNKLKRRYSKADWALKNRKMKVYFSLWNTAHKIPRDQISKGILSRIVPHITIEIPSRDDMPDYGVHAYDTLNFSDDRCSEVYFMKESIERLRRVDWQERFKKAKISKYKGERTGAPATKRRAKR